mgnify:FL=1
MSSCRATNANATEGWGGAPQPPYTSADGNVRVVFRNSLFVAETVLAGRIHSAVGLTPAKAASALTEKLRALRAALADVLGEEEGT